MVDIIMTLRIRAILRLLQSIYSGFLHYPSACFWFECGRRYQQRKERKEEKKKRYLTKYKINVEIISRTISCANSFLLVCYIRFF